MSGLEDIYTKCAVCGSTYLIHLHHIKPVYRGGRHQKDNVIPLCPDHHEAVHQGSIDPVEYKKRLDEKAPR